jgi:phosphonate transport system substrate-binding protein
MRKVPLLALLPALALLVLSGCGGGQSAGADTADPETLRVALLPDENANTVIQNNKPLEAYLEEELGKEIELVVTTDYSSMIEAMSRGRLELAYFGPLSYTLAKQRADIEPFAGLVYEGEEEPVYYSILIGSAEQGVDEPADAKGKNVAFGDPASTSSHLIPKLMLQQEGLEAERDYTEQFVGSHDAVALAVQNGNAAVGGLSKPIFESLIDKGTIDENKVEVLKESEPYPNFPWTMRSDLNPELKQSVRDTFLHLDDPRVLEPFEAKGFAPVEDSDYDKVRELADRLELTLEELAQ